MRTRMTMDARSLLTSEADIRAQMTSYKDLAQKTGLSEEYIANFVGRLIRAKRENVEISVPRVTEKVDIEALAQQIESQVNNRS